MNEIQVWEHLIKWGLAQNPELSSDLTSFSKDDFNTLKNTKFNFQRIFEEKSRTSIKEIESKNIDSKIITNQHVEIISKWIDGLEITDKLASSYEFKLLYRDSEESGGALVRIKKFHEVCDDHSRTVTIFKVKDRNEILGGYNPIEWKSDNNENCILSRVNDETRAINNNIFDGPSFGLDLYLCCGRKIFCKQHSYEKQIKIDNDDALLLDFFELNQ
ncbi:hypothetical protein RhiirB3_453983 [Rhizophagus irregularis]|nr:hypothetical protein RhiirB3_453983 [Rhizophagus irregularis]